jgi:UDPglucose 6-dehydrogenase
LSAFIAISESLGAPFGLLKEVQAINAHQLQRFIKMVREALWILKDKQIAVWGLSFKPHTDDVRDSVAVTLIETLVSEGARVTVFDPQAMEKARALPVGSRINFASSPLDAAKGAEALIIATEWPQFAAVNLEDLREAMRTPLIFDGRNLLDPTVAAEFGFQYHSIGRGQPVTRG